MAKTMLVAQMALAALAEAKSSLWGSYQDLRCDLGHGGTPLDGADTPLQNVSMTDCEEHCDGTSACVAFVFHNLSHYSHRSSSGDCYFRSAIDVGNCSNTASQRNSYFTVYQVAPPPLKGNIVYHLFEPKYTGLADKDAGDFKGDAGFIFSTFSKFEMTNPEASMEHNIIEMSEVDVTGWGTYEQCNSPGAEGLFTCPSNQSIYCCTTHDPANRSHNIPANHTRDQLPGIDVSKMTLGPMFGFGGFWYSFPAESQDVTWTERLKRRIAGKCLGDAWRNEAGGCNECGESLDSCVADCIKAALCVNGSTVQLEAVWNRVFADPSECPEVPLPSNEQPFTDDFEVLRFPPATLAV
jgi:hypothetical protein